MSVSNNYTNNLAQQAYQPSRWLLFVSTNASCRGGVEAILQAKGRRPQQAPDESLGMSSLTLSEQQQQQPMADASSNSHGSNASSSNPFSFLSEPDTAPSSSQPPTKTKSSKLFAGRRLLQSVASQTSASLERGLHSLAKTATKGYAGGAGVSDLMFVSCGDNESTASTERLPNPEASSTTTRFTLPITLSGRESQVTLSLYIKSGVLASHSKPILLATSVLQLPQQQQSGGTTAISFQSLVWQPASSVAAALLPPAAALHICLQPDNKVPALCGRGWSLADPTLVAATAPGSLYNVPLDQSYAYSLQSAMAAAATTSSVSSQQQQSSASAAEPFLMATERATESTIVLPIAAAWARLASQAASVSLKSAQQMSERLRYDSVDPQLTADYVHVECSVQYLQLQNHGGSAGMMVGSQQQQQQPLVSCSWQRPDSIFEVELLQPSPVSTVASNTRSASFKFFPRPIHDIDSVLPSLRPHMDHYKLGFLLGSLKLSVQAPAHLSPSTLNERDGQVVPSNPFDSVTTQQATKTLTGNQQPWSCWEALLPLEPLLQQATGNNQSLSIPLYNAGAPTGCALVILMSVMRQRGTGVSTNSSGQQQQQCGLVSLVGLPPLVPQMLDDDEMTVVQDPQQQQRLTQLGTMGKFVTSAYLSQHVNAIRKADVHLLHERCQSYTSAVVDAATAMSTNLVSNQQPTVPPCQDRRPRPFRPSSSRMDVSLGGIPFNVHSVSWSLQVMDPNSGDPASQQPGDVFFNTTCGAPADHARGFGNVMPAIKPSKTFKHGTEPQDESINVMSPVGPVSGGLRRLEAKRNEIADMVNRMQSDLITSVATYFDAARQGHPQQQTTHIPARCNMPQLHVLRWKIIQSVQALHHVTWICAVRRAAVFSQALGLAMTSFLASLSDPAKCHWSWPDFWVRHGYLVSFEGLLSAAGKELGMIEDASIAIDMLRMVQVVLVRDDAASNASRLSVPGSPYVSWIDLRTSVQASRREFVLQVGVNPAYFDQRIPAALKNGCYFRFYSLLFEVGVDIRQWGAYAVGSSNKNQADGEKVIPVGLIDEEDDDVGVCDEDELVQLNYEALQKLNAYAYWLSPANSSVSQQKTHPLIETLHQHVVSSAGKINHDILDEAAQLAQQLGGGGIVFCKSGKDRTAMHVTYKQAQFLNRFRERRPSPDPSIAFVDTTLGDANLIRICGTRLPICEKNVGDSKYAFNALQVKFMPDALKPPMNTLAGFLKGGKVFGGIES